MPGLSVTDEKKVNFMVYEMHVFILAHGVCF